MKKNNFKNKAALIIYYREVASDLDLGNGFLSASWLYGITLKQLEQDWKQKYSFQFWKTFPKYWPKETVIKELAV